MLFNSTPFFLFFAVVLAACWSAPARHRNRVLLAASLLFYIAWIPVYLLLLLASIALNYGLLRALLPRPGHRPLVVAVCLLNLGVLGVFKYATFIVGSLAPVAEVVTGRAPPIPELLLPLGISFFTFQMLGFAIDAYRGRAEPVRSFWDYALFVSFFPQLIAGPILRSSQLMPQLKRGGVRSREGMRVGLWLVAWGLTKKVVMGDFLLAPFVDRIHGFPQGATGPDLIVMMYAFAFQIYFDFSGYTDIARGLARLLGFELPLNFREPYLARNPAEFWRRWHMTLSSWLRDYLYISLGGNRRGTSRTLLNLFLTMLLGGLWHGAAWTFVLWGGMHGILLLLHRLWSTLPFVSAKLGESDDTPLRWRDAPRVFSCFTAVAALLVVFRADGMNTLAVISSQVLASSPLDPWPILPGAVVVFCVLLHGAERAVHLHWEQLLRGLAGPWGGLAEGALMGLMAALVVLLGGAAGGEFIYFQF